MSAPGLECSSSSSRVPAYPMAAARWTARVEGGPRRVNHAAVAVTNPDRVRVLARVAVDADGELLLLLYTLEATLYPIAGLLLRRLLHGGQLQGPWGAHRRLRTQRGHPQVAQGARVSLGLRGNNVLDANYLLKFCKINSNLLRKIT